MSEITSCPAFNETNARNYKAWILREEHPNILVLSEKMRLDICHWLENSSDKPCGNRAEKQEQYNIRNKALMKFELYHGQIYCKPKTVTRKGKRLRLDAYLAICQWDSFSTIVCVHEEFRV